jgi:hypothetical protein
MWSIRTFHRRIPLGPTVIALALITLLVLTNLYGSGGDVQARDGTVTPSPMDIPPQLPAQDQSVEATPGHAGPTPPASAAPSGQPVPQPTVTVTTTVTAPAADGRDSGDRPKAATASPTGRQSPGGSTSSGGGGSSGGTGATPSSNNLRVTGVGIISDRASGSYVRCDGIDEVAFAGTVKVDGGAGEVLYQWVFDRILTWPPDVLSFTGSGARQQTFQIPWRVPIQFGRVTGTVQLRILQPVANAQTTRYDVNFSCRPIFSLP